MPHPPADDHHYDYDDVDPRPRDRWGRFLPIEEEEAETPQRQTNRWEDDDDDDSWLDD